MKYDSVAVGIEESHNSLFTLKPNPTSNKTIIDFTNDNNITKDIELFNIIGDQLLKVHTNENKISLDLEEYKSGVYLIKVKMINSTFSGKIFKN
jgi:hypothetical protein